MQAKDVIDRARIVLQDAGSDYWAQNELPKWLTDGRMEAYRLRPDLYQVTETVDLVEGARQELPDGARVFFGAIRNVSDPGERHITLMDDGLLSLSRPSWRSGPASAEIIHYLPRGAVDSQYDVYPPAAADVQIEISYAALPDAIDTYDSETKLTQEGEYAPALVDYVLYRAFLKEADTVPAFQQRAAQHYAAFQAALVGAQPQAATQG